MQGKAAYKAIFGRGLMQAIATVAAVEVTVCMTAQNGSSINFEANFKCWADVDALATALCMEKVFTTLTDVLSPEEVTLVASGRRIAAIKSVRERLNLSLHDAKRLVDREMPIR